MSDYIQNGFKYCGVCRRPKEIVLTIGEKNMRVAVRCSCESAERERTEAELRKSSSYISAMATAAVYEINVEPTNCADKVRRYVAAFERMYADGVGLLLWGDVGTGKSVSAAWACNELKKQKIPCLMSNFSTLVTLDGIPKLNKYDLVVFDDLGAERQSDFMVEGVFRLIDQRVNAKKPMIITTNHSLEQIKNPSEMKYKRLYDRILSVCVPIRISGESHRKEQGEQRLKMARELLG